MAVDKFLECQPHEGDLHLIFNEWGLAPYYAMDAIRKDHDSWQSDGKPTATMQFDGVPWRLCYDYDTDNPLDPWNHTDYQLQTVPEFRFYFVASDELFDGERADQSARIRGGTITVRPRWPDMTADGKRVRGVPNLGGPYIDVQVQASNIDHERYLQLVREIFAQFGLNDRYFRTPHEMSNWNDAAVYVRGRRGETGPIFAADGPIARTHQLLEADRRGYRQHKEDHRKLPGYYVSTQITDDRANDLIKGHSLGKEIKHYYSKFPKNRDRSDPLRHPKLEVSLQSSLTEETVYWHETDDLVRELEETLLNVIDWAELPVRGGDPWIRDAYFLAADGERRSRKFVDCPLPKIEDAQQHAVMKLWGETLQSDKAVIDVLLADGGAVSPKDVAAETGYCYRTIREAVDRCSAVVKHTYGKLEIESKHQRKLLLQRMRTAEESFKTAIENAAMTAAEVATGRERGRWSEVRRRYNITVDDDPSDCRKLLRVGYEPDDEYEAREVVQSIKNAYLECHNDRGGVFGVHAVVTIGTVRKRYKNLETTRIAPRRGTDKEREHQEKVASVDWDAWMAADLGADKNGLDSSFVDAG